MKRKLPSFMHDCRWGSDITMADVCVSKRDVGDNDDQGTGKAKGKFGPLGRKPSDDSQPDGQPDSQQLNPDSLQQAMQPDGADSQSSSQQPGSIQQPPAASSSQASEVMIPGTPPEAFVNFISDTVREKGAATVALAVRAAMLDPPAVDQRFLGRADGVQRI